MRLPITVTLILAALALATGCRTTHNQGLRPVRASDTPSIWPVRNPGPITSQFGPRCDSTTGQTHQHNGLDISVPKHTPVFATADGIVTFAGPNQGYGLIVKLLHARNIETWYAHLDKIYVKQGRRVRQADPIGTTGCSGNATGPHLHYEIRLRGTPTNPAPYLPPQP